MLTSRWRRCQIQGFSLVMFIVFVVGLLSATGHQTGTISRIYYSLTKLTDQEVQRYASAIWDLDDDTYGRMRCPGEDHLPKRYAILEEAAQRHVSSQKKYFFAIDLYQVRNILPRLMGTVVQVVKLLGPEKCAISIVEGRSQDNTYEILLALKERFQTIGVEVSLTKSEVNPHGKGIDRIGALSVLRNLALQPLRDGAMWDTTSTSMDQSPIVANKTTDPKPAPRSSDKHTHRSMKVRRANPYAEDDYATRHHLTSQSSQGKPMYDNNTVIVFINDVVVCPDDVFELIFQHQFQSAHQTCAMDWTRGGKSFYDAWVSRSMSGDTFFEIAQGNDFYIKNMFWDHPPTKKKYDRNQPFQVYSCWGGMVTLSSAPFLHDGIKFHNSTHDECYAGEPINLAKDLWASGYGKILTVPTVNVAYSNSQGRSMKNRRGFVKDHVNMKKTEAQWNGTELIEWKKSPPCRIKCIPTWGFVGWTDP